MPNPAIIQQASSASTVAAPASFTTAAFTASTAKSLLVALVAVAESAAATVSTPISWTLDASTNSAGNTIGGRIYHLDPSINGGGINTVTFSTLTAVNGIAVAIYEISNVSLTPLDKSAGASNNSTTAVSSGAVTPTVSNEVWLGFETDLTGQAYTNTASASFVAGTTATSTTGATNVIIRPFSSFPGPAVSPGDSLVIAGTLAGALANSAMLASYISSISSIQAVGPGGQILATAGAGYGVGI